MKVNGIPYRPIWEADGAVRIIDQTRLPFAFTEAPLRSEAEAVRAIADMWVRGAPLIGATAAYGLALAMREDASDANLAAAHDRLFRARPTAVNLRWAIDDVAARIRPLAPGDRAEAAWLRARAIADEDVELCRMIGVHGLPLIEAVAARKGRVNVLTHCNAGWLATCDWGTATSPIYQAHDKGIDVHVWVDETRPRNQGAFLTAWELGQHGVPHTVIVDNAGGHLMQHGQVDLCFVGTDRTTFTGDVANKIGTYLKALAAHDNGIPFYVALPSSTFDWEIEDGLTIPIEQRSADEVRFIQGRHGGETKRVLLTPESSPAVNYAFDVTPRRYVTGLISERGICAASAEGVLGLYPEMRK